MASLKINTLYIYPIKSLRGVTVQSAPLTPHGFPYDRRFMLLKVHDTPDQNPRKTGSRFENMHISAHPLMCKFTLSLDLPKDSNGRTDWSGSSGKGSVEVTYTNPDDGSTSHLTVPLHPETTHLETIDVNMHQSEMTGLMMPESYSAWFSERFGFGVIFAYLGPSYRPVLGNLAPNASERNAIRRAKAEEEKNASKSKSWLSGIVNNMPGLPTVFSNGTDAGKENGFSTTPGEAAEGKGSKQHKEDYEITFADCAPYLIVNKTSGEQVSTRLPDGEDMEIEKFRPNIVVEGAQSAFEEDYWAEVMIRPKVSGSDDVLLKLTANCVRCASLNVDWDTGKFGKGEKGQVLKKLQKDRRVDAGHKYGPVFGRYAFLPYEFLKDGQEYEISAGDEIEVTKRNDERTVLMWPGLGQTPKDDHFPIC